MNNPFEEIKQELESIKTMLKEKQPAPEEILTRERTCEILDISISTFKKWAKAGKLKTHNMGDRVYCLRSEVIKSLAEINKAA